MTPRRERTPSGIGTIRPIGSDQPLGVSDAERGAWPDLSDYQLEALRPYGTTRDVTAGETLPRAGDPSYDFAVILAGGVAIVEDYGRPTERTLAEHGPRRFLGELDLLTGERALVTAVVREDGQVLTIAPDEPRRLMGREPLVSDLILRAFLLRRALLIGIGAGLKIVGSRFSPDTRRLRDFCARNRLAHVVLDLERQHGAEALLRAAKISPDETPVVITPDFTVLRNPSNAELASAIGMRSVAPPAGPLRPGRGGHRTTGGPGGRRLR